MMTSPGRQAPKQVSICPVVTAPPIGCKPVIRLWCDDPDRQQMVLMEIENCLEHFIMLERSFGMMRFPCQLLW
jgi:hypothetical protein